MTFRALLADRTDDGQTLSITDIDDSQLHDGDVTVDVDFSTVNYKDGLALTGQGKVLRTFPMVPGIDLAGTVVEGAGGFAAGDQVVLNGWGVGESHSGGYAQRARLKSEWLVKLPEGLNTRQAMAIGTAGYTAMLAVLALEHNGVTPDNGEVLVTGAAGGVGSVSIALLSKLGYTVVASTGRAEESDYLKGLGATEIIDRATLSEPSTRPLNKERYAGVIDSVGSHTLVNALTQVKRNGAVSACGLAQGNDLTGTVLPFLLRGVTLAGIDSVYAPQARREIAWQRLATDVDTDKLEQMTSVIGLEDLEDIAPKILAGRVRGRTVVDPNR
jgi:acrylyl-CoA reductase (NADPH)